MKPTCALACILLIPGVGVAQNAASTNAAAANAALANPVAPSAGATTALPVSVPVPVVRVPVGGVVMPPVESEMRESASTTAPSVAAAPSEMSGELGWSSTAVGLREPMVTTVRTNRGIETGGVFKRAARPERRGFGGFLAGFGNLFNPFAPTSKGVETRGAQWYDGGVQSAPLPRGLRDERTHEAQTPIFSVDFGVDVPEEAAPPPPPKETVPLKR